MLISFLHILYTLGPIVSFANHSISKCISDNFTGDYYWEWIMPSIKFKHLITWGNKVFPVNKASETSWPASPAAWILPWPPPAAPPVAVPRAPPAPPAPASPPQAAGLAGMPRPGAAWRHQDLPGGGRAEGRGIHLQVQVKVQDRKSCSKHRYKEDTGSNARTVLF